MPLPCDPSPYRTIAAALLAARDSRPMPTPAEQRATRVRDRAALSAYVARQRASDASLADANARVAAAKAERFTDTHGDYRPIPKPAPFTTRGR